MYPSVESYLSKLPRGIDSYPSAQIKGVVVRGTVEKAGVQSSLDLAGVPPTVAELFTNPPTVNAWVPEVHLGALVAAVYDVRFQRTGGMAAYDQWVFEWNLQVFKGPLYRVLFMVASPERVFMGAANRWGAFHRGSVVTILKHERRRVRLRISYPSHLFVDQMIYGQSAALRATLVAAGAKNPRVQCEIESDTASVYEGEWA